MARSDEENENTDNRLWPNITAFCFGGFVAGLLIFVYLYEIVGRGPITEIEPDKAMDFTEFSSILLTAVAVLVTVLGVMMAFLAFIGFRYIREQARDSAAAEAILQIKESLQEGGVLRDVVEEQIKAIARESLVASHLTGNAKDEDTEWIEDEETQAEEQEKEDAPK